MNGNSNYKHKDVIIIQPVLIILSSVKLTSIINFDYNDIQAIKDNYLHFVHILLK